MTHHEVFRFPQAGPGPLPPPPNPIARDTLLPHAHAEVCLVDGPFVPLLVSTQRQMAKETCSLCCLHAQCACKSSQQAFGLGMLALAMGLIIPQRDWDTQRHGDTDRAREPLGDTETEVQRERERVRE